MTVLLLLASLAWGQASTDTATVPLAESLEISNLGKAVRELQSGYYVQTGEPVFKNGFCFDVARTNCQTSAATPGVTTVGFGSMTITADQTGIGTSYTTVTGSTVSVTVITSNNPVECCFGIVFAPQSANATASAQVLVDNVVIGGGSYAGTGLFGQTVGAFQGWVSACPTSNFLSSGAHKFYIRAKTDSGTLTLTNSLQNAFMVCKEIKVN